MPDTPATPLSTFNAVAQSMNELAIAKSSPRQADLEEQRALGRALMGGTKAMRAAKQLYMPKHPAESQENYDTRLKKTILFGGFSMAVVKQASKLFVKDIQVEKGSTALMALLEDIDGEGRALSPFAYDVVREGFVDGVSYILVDMPQMVAGATLADTKLQKVRPYWVHVKAKDVLGWKSQRIGADTTLTELRILEDHEIALDEYNSTCEQWIRLLRRGSWQLWKPVRKDGAIVRYDLDSEGTTTWDDITVVPVYINRTAFFEGAPPLREMAELNQEHWDSSSEQRNALSFLRFAMLAIIGAEDSTDPNKTVKIAPSKVINLPLQGDAKYVEHTGKGIEAGDTDIANIEQRMQTAGLELRVENQGTVTATAAAIDSAESNAALKAVAQGVGDAIALALVYTEIMLAVTPNAELAANVYDEFAEDIPPGEAQVFVNLRNNGMLSLRSAWRELQRRGILSPDFDPDEEQTAIDNEAPSLMGAPLPSGVARPGGPAPAKKPDNLNKIN